MCPSGHALLGDLTKYASMSHVLFASVECTSSGMTVQMGKFSSDVSVVEAGKVVVVSAVPGETLRF